MMFKFARHILMLTVALSAATAAIEQAAAQHYVGVRGGYGNSNGSRFAPKYDMRSLGGMYNAGVSWKYFTKQKYVGGTEVDILFMQQGFKEYGRVWSLDGQDSTAYNSRKVNSVVIPIFWQPHAYLFRRNMRVFLNLGVTFSYNLSQTYEHGSDRDGIFDKGDYKMTLIRDNRWGYGLAGGGGIGWSFGRIEVVGEIRYYIGYSDLQKNKNKYWNNQDWPVEDQNRFNRLRTPLDGLQGSVAVFYRLGKKGILSPPSPKMEKKLREIEEKRLGSDLPPGDIPPPEDQQDTEGIRDYGDPEEIQDTAVPEDEPNTDEEDPMRDPDAFAALGTVFIR